MKRNVGAGITAISIASIALFGCLVTLFFTLLNLTLSDESWGDIGIEIQSFFNFTRGWYYTTSVYRLAGVVSFNPFPYMHLFAIHIYALIFPLFAPIYKMSPTINTLYAVSFLFSYLGIGLFGWLILKKTAVDKLGTRFWWCFSLLLTSNFLGLLLGDKVNPVGLVCPFVLAAYYFFLKDNLAAFLTTCMLLCLVSEDVAMLVMSLAMYIYFFEPSRRRYAYYSFGFSAIYFMVVLTVIQPAARYDLGGASYFITRLKQLSQSFNIPRFLVKTIPLALFSHTFFVSRKLSLKPDPFDWKRTLGLVFVAPLSFWAIAMGYGSFSQHHQVVVFTFAYLALLLSVSKLNLADSLSARQWGSIGIILAVFAGINTALTVRDSGGGFLVRKLFKLPQKTLISMETVATNKTVIQAITAIPDHFSVVYWTNRNVEGFVLNRRDIWRFPYYYDVSDFLVIQKNAAETFFDFDPRAVEKSGQISTGREHSSNDSAIISPTELDWIVQRLVVKAKTHRIVVDRPEVTVLERLEKKPFVLTPTMVGLGWVQNIPKLWVKHP